ncbi:MAG: cell envelope integrity protein TolA, partial [Polaromonas sp.]
QQQQQQKEAELLAKKEKDRERDLKAKEDQAKRKALDDAKKLEAKKQEVKEQANANSLAEQRKQNLARAMGLAGATGGDTAKGSALKSTGPSASYGGKVKAKVRPNIVFTEDIQGNPSAEVEVRTGLDGTIMSQRLVKSSGNKAWDDAVIKAIIRTETMPRDVDGRVPTPMIIEFRPKD